MTLTTLQLDLIKQKLFARHIRSDDDYDDYDDQQRYDDAVADDLFWTFLGADDEMRYSEDAE